jgi:hypothetical protein
MLLSSFHRVFRDLDAHYCHATNSFATSWGLLEFYGCFPTIASMVRKNFVIQGAFGKAERVTLVESIIGVVLNDRIFIERDDKALSDFLIRQF